MPTKTSLIRTVVVVLAAFAALAVGAGSALAHPLTAVTGTVEDATRASARLTGAEDRTVTVSAASVPQQSTGIGPGARLLVDIEGEGTFGCTASYVFESGSTLLLGAAGHCFLPADVPSTHGTGYDGSRTSVQVCVSGCSFGGQTGFVLEGEMVDLGALRYARQETGAGDQLGWDFGVVEIPAELHDQVRTTMPVFGGPTRAGTLTTGDLVCHYGNGVVLGEAYPTMGRSGAGLLADDDVWFAGTAASPGDSGSAVQTCTTDGEGLSGVAAVGTLTHVTPLGVVGTTNAQAVEMAEDDAGLSLQLLVSDGAG